MKKLISLLSISLLALTLVACGSDKPKEPEQPVIPDLTGTWEYASPDDEATYFEAIIRDETITINMVMEDEGYSLLYWDGTFTAPTTADEPYTWESKNNTEKTSASLLGSSSAVKTFTYENGKISYEFSMQGQTTTIPLEKVTSDIPTEPEEANESSEFYFKDNVLLTEEVKIEITDYGVIPAGEGINGYGDTPIIAFWYDTTNISGVDTDASSAWIYSMTAVQDNDPNTINTLDLAIFVDNEYTDTAMQTIKKDGTVSNMIAYEIDDDVTPVVLTATNGMLGEELGTQEFKIK